MLAEAERELAAMRTSHYDDRFFALVARADRHPHASRANGLDKPELVVIVDAARRPIGYRWSTTRHSAAHRAAIAIARI